MPNTYVSRNVAKNIFRIAFLYGCTLVLLASCASFSENDPSRQLQEPLEPLSCVVVLPAIGSADQDETIAYKEAQSLEQGAAYATDVMQSTLRENPKARIIGFGRHSSGIHEAFAGTTWRNSALLQNLPCQAVLLTTVRRYQQREGTDYAVDAPASVNFSMVLRHTTTGRPLWTTEFQEKQQSLLSNIFSFKKAQNRNFKWVTAEQLMEQGIQQRLMECPYLK